MNTSRRIFLASSCALLSLFAAGVSLKRAAAQQTPILDMVANRVIQKYQQSNCEDLWKKKGAPPTAEEQKVVNFLRNDPQMRITFINKVAAPIANKMFECGLLP